MNTRILTTTLFLFTVSFTQLMAQNVGIGLTDPLNRLDVRSDGSADTSHIVLGLISYTSQRPVLQFSEWEFATMNSGMSIEYDGYGYTGYDNRMHIRDVYANPRFTFVASGRMGIGTTNPYEMLEIGGSGRLFIGDGGDTARTGLLIDANEPGRYVRLQPYDYNIWESMPLFIPDEVRVGFGTTNPDTSALIHMSTLDKGLLVPRMQQTHREGIDNPADGLLVYQTDLDTGFWYFRGNTWVPMGYKSMSLADGDCDTGVDVEKTPDEDMIRFYVDTLERWIMTGARLEPHNSGGAIFIGELAGELDSMLNTRNIGIGYEALRKNTSRTGNVAVGAYALQDNGEGAQGSLQSRDNTAVGNLSMSDNTTGFFNAALGSYSMSLNTTGLHNTALGYAAMYTNTGGQKNTAVGYASLYKNSTGLGNAALGNQSLFNCTTARWNSALGHTSLENTTTGWYNTGVGYDAGEANVLGAYNTLIGAFADLGDTALVNATAIGANAIVSADSSLVLGDAANVGIGISAPANKLDVKSTRDIGATDVVLALISPTNQNPILHFSEWETASSVSSGMGIEYEGHMQIGDDNRMHIRAVGGSRKFTFMSGGRMGIGTTSPNDMLEIAAADPRVFIGDGQGSNRSGLLLDGVEAGGNTRIHAYDYSTASTIDINIPSQVLMGVWGGTTTYELEVVGSAAKNSGASWTVVSDGRLKHNIQDYNEGLEEVLQIRPVRYKYNEESGYATDEEHVGVVAQELQTVAPHMIGSFEKNDETYLSVNNSAMTYMLINAVQEQQAIIEAQQEQINELRAIVEQLQN